MEEDYYHSSRQMPQCQASLVEIDEIQSRVAAIEAALREYGVGAPTGWTDEVYTKLAELSAGLASCESSISEGNRQEI